MEKQIIISIIFLLVLPLISAGNYGASTYSTGDYNVGEVAVVPPPAPSGGGACTYNWDCTNWFPLECPESGIQERICSNRGTCTGIVGMPNQTQTCIYEGPTEPLFDIFLTIPQEYTQICSGKKIKADIKLENYGKVELIDAFMTYWILNENNSLIAELKDTRAVEERINFQAEIKIPESTPKGIYRLYAEITYSGNKTAIAGESFEIMEEESCKIQFTIPKYIYFILIAIILFVLIVIITIIIIKKIKKYKSIRSKRIEKRKDILDKIKTGLPATQKKIKPKEEEVISRGKIDREIKKEKDSSQLKERKKSLQKRVKSPQSKARLKKDMFNKLLKDKIKLKTGKKK